MSVDIHDEVPTPPSETGLNKALEGFEESCGELLRACRMYMNLPVAVNLNAIKKAGEFSAAKWEASMASIIEDNTMDAAERAQIAATLLKDNDMRRFIYLGRILENIKAFSSSADQDQMAASLEVQFRAEGVSDEIAIASLKQMYVNGLNVDLGVFLAEVEKQPRARAVKHGRIAGKHLFDVLKIGAGVWAGNKLIQRSSQK